MINRQKGRVPNDMFLTTLMAQILQPVVTCGARLSLNV